MTSHSPARAAQEAAEGAEGMAASIEAEEAEWARELRSQEARSRPRQRMLPRDRRMPVSQEQITGVEAVVAIAETTTPTAGRLPYKMAIRDSPCGGLDFREL